MTTVVAFHAHPDDEVLLTGGTLAGLSGEGHRVVVVVACDGIVGLADGAPEPTRLSELNASAELLGVARVVHLGYADSGHGPQLYPDPPDRTRFARADVDEAAAKLAAVLRDEGAEVLLSYDRHGGYGHRDHIRVHEVGARAAESVGGIRVLEATVPREIVVTVFGVLRRLRLMRRFDPQAIARAYSPRSSITHRVPVCRYASQKRAALAAHTSQVTGSGRAGAGYRLLLRLPTWLFGLLFGREWFIEAGAAPQRPRMNHVLLRA